MGERTLRFEYKNQVSDWFEWMHNSNKIHNRIVARAASFLESKGFRIGEEITFQRFVRVVDEAKQNEKILLYVEAGNALGSTQKEKMTEQFLERAVKGLKVLK